MNAGNPINTSVDDASMSTTITEEYRYPAINLPDEHRFIDQVFKVAEECQEFLDEVAEYRSCVATGNIAGGCVAYDAAMFEMCNIEHAIETARRINPIAVLIAAQQTVEKNEERGYYAIQG